jgi:hypothetical protein
MRVLAFDISSKTGFAVIEDGKLISYGLIKPSKIYNPEEIDDINAVRNACKISSNLMDKIAEVVPDKVFAEQTNAGRFRSSQKELEFIHFAFLYDIIKNFQNYIPNLAYVDTSKWRSILQIKLTKEQRKHNKDVKLKTKRGKITPKHLVVTWANEKYGLQLLKKDHDIADAIAIATFGYHTSVKQKVQSDAIEKIIE